MVNPVAEEGEIAAQGIVGEDAREGMGEAEGGTHGGAATFEKAQPNGLTHHMGVERHNEGAAVNEIGPQAQVHWRPAAHHPPQEHTDTLTRRLGILGYHHADPSAAKIMTDGLHGGKTVGGILPYVIAESAVFL